MFQTTKAPWNYKTNRGLTLIDWQDRSQSQPVHRKTQRSSRGPATRRKKNLTMTKLSHSNGWEGIQSCSPGIWKHSQQTEGMLAVNGEETQVANSLSTPEKIETAKTDENHVNIVMSIRYLDAANHPTLQHSKSLNEIVLILRAIHRSKEQFSTETHPKSLKSSQVPQILLIDSG